MLQFIKKRVTAMYDKIKSYLSKETRQKNLYVVTVCMFVFLVLEKLLSGLSLSSLTADFTLVFSLGLSDVVCLVVYITVTLLLILKVRYKFILLPDSVLFSVKLYALATAVIKLVSAPKIGLLTELSLIESVTEGFFFALFLTVLFIGKLTSNKKAKHTAPVVCLAILALCLPATVAFEVIKVFVEESVYNFPVSVEIFLFAKGVANEIFLDLPYALLVLLMFFVPQKNDTTA